MLCYQIKNLKKQVWGEWLLRAILKICRVDGAFYLETEKMKKVEWKQ